MNPILLKPLLIGIHLGFAIIGIDALLWLVGELVAKSTHLGRKVAAASIAAGAFLGSWWFGGYYYVVFYGTAVKPVIKEGLAPWAHGIVMETKEHIFLFVVPLVLTILFATLTKDEGIRPSVLRLTLFTALLGLAIGLMGFTISAAARFGASS